jgi:radical SAM protein with 4Fe4S-binding SPASM domain
VSNILCDHAAGNEKLRYGHRAKAHAAFSEAQRTPRPVVVWAVTRACNLRCVHCYAAAGADPDANELTHDEGIALLEDLKAFGAPAVLFSGGEPLARPDTLQLIGHARQIGLNCTLSTNGLLITDDLARQLAELGLRYVGISLDGMAARHDKLRGLEGAFEQTLAAIERCQQQGLKVGVRFTVHALNLQDLDPIIDLCIDRGIDRLCVYHLAYAGRGGNMQKVDLTARQTRAIIDRLFERTRQAHDQGHDLEVLTVGNHADAAYAILALEQRDPQRAAQITERLSQTGGNRSGCNIASIDPTGGVHYDQFSWHYACGNIREKPFSRIWTEASDPRLAVLRDRQPHLPATCQGCRFLDLCNGNLRTRAEAATGNWLGDDPSCYLTDAERIGSVAATR